jgi:thymidylate kinase
MPHDPGVVRKLVRSWLFQDVGWFALIELALRILLEAGFVILLAFLGLNVWVIVPGWIIVHTLLWLLPYGGMPRIWALFKFPTEIPKIQGYLGMVTLRAQREPSFDLVVLRGSMADGRFDALSDIDLLIVPGRTLGSKVRALLVLWGMRSTSVFQRVQLQARSVDVERYLPFLTIDETPRALSQRHPVHREGLRQTARTRGCAVLISLSGLDGAGKSTAAHGLVSRLRARGIRAEYFYGHRQAFGPRLSFAIAFESIWKDIGRSLEDLRRDRGPRLLYDLLTCLDYLSVRWLLGKAHRRAEVIVIDRYVADVLAYLRFWGAVYGSLEGLLAGASLEPDLAILMRIDPDIAFARKREHSPERLHAVAKAYAEMTKLLRLVEVDAGRSIDQVEEDLERIVDATLGELDTTPTRSGRPLLGADYPAGPSDGA